VSEIDNVTRGLSELMIADVLEKHGVRTEQKRTLTDEEKEHLRTLVEDLKTQVEQFVQHRPAAPVVVEHVQTGKTEALTKSDNHVSGNKIVHESTTRKTSSEARLTRMDAATRNRKPTKTLVKGQAKAGLKRKGKP